MMIRIKREFLIKIKKEVLREIIIIKREIIIIMIRKIKIIIKNLLIRIKILKIIEKTIKRRIIKKVVILKKITKREIRVILEVIIRILIIKSNRMIGVQILCLILDKKLRIIENILKMTTIRIERIHSKTSMMNLITNRNIEKVIKILTKIIINKSLIIRKISLIITEKE